MKNIFLRWPDEARRERVFALYDMRGKSLNMLEHTLDFCGPLKDFKNEKVFLAPMIVKLDEGYARG